MWIRGGVFLFGMPGVSFRRKSHSRLHEVRIASDSRSVILKKMKHKRPEFRMQYRPMTDREMKEREQGVMAQ
jgi:hypothetical protein